MRITDALPVVAFLACGRSQRARHHHRLTRQSTVRPMRAMREREAVYVRAPFQLSTQRGLALLASHRASFRVMGAHPDLGAPASAMLRVLTNPFAISRGDVWSPKTRRVRQWSRAHRAILLVGQIAIRNS